jgi:hypothetical protein
MLSGVTGPDGLSQVWEALRGVFTAPTFAVFKALVEGMPACTGEHAVTGMWIAAGMAGRGHWSATHRFFSHAAGIRTRSGCARPRWRRPASPRTGR